ncbi:MAG: hypothetical protein QM783_16815 [Phycisphaerales bacterium]
MAIGGSSKRQYSDYLAHREREAQNAKALDTPSARGGATPAPKADWTTEQPRGKRKASRPAMGLLREFWKLLRPRRTMIYLSLLTVTLQAMLGMISAR